MFPHVFFFRVGNSLFRKHRWHQYLSNHIPYLGTNIFFLNKASRSGGFALYISKSLSFRALNDLRFTYDNLKSLFIIVNTDNEQVILGVTYRRLRSLIDYFMYDYRMISQYFFGRETQVCGKFNLDLFFFETSNLLIFQLTFASNNVFYV